MIAALISFAALALAVVDNAQRRDLDAQLATTARALHLVGDSAGGKLEVDQRDREQFSTIAGSKADGAIVAADGSIAVSSDARTVRGLLPRVVGSTNPHFETVASGADLLRVYSEPIQSKQQIIGYIVTWHDADIIEDLDRNVALAFALAIPLIAALAILAGREIARRGLEPVERIATLASEIEAHDLSRRLTMDGRDDELGRLGGTFNRMLDRLQSAFDRERRFTSDASHELRAPLSVIRAEADLALRKDRTPAEYQTALETIAAEADSLEELTRDLLAAARETSNGDEATSAVDISGVAECVAQRMSVLAAARRVHVEQTSSEPIYVVGNRVMLERAVLSVVHNALKYAAPEGTVEIQVARLNGSANVSIRDNGPGFSEEALRHGFDRFWRDAENRTQDGSGLGLALAKTIVERFDGTIELENAEPHGAVVTMAWPAQPPGDAKSS